MQAKNFLIPLAFSMLVFAGCREDKKQAEAASAAIEPESDTEEPQGEGDYGENACDSDELCNCEDYRIRTKKRTDAVIERTDIVVRTADEFRNAIGSNRNILMKQGVYKFSDELSIDYVENMTIKGMDSKPAEIIVERSDRYVARFVCSDNITIENVKAGHATQASPCDEGVLQFKGCRDIKIDNTHMYGSGTIGLYLEEVINMEVTNSSIYECTNSIMYVLSGTYSQSENISFKNCLFRDNDGGVDLNLNFSEDSKVILAFDGCEFRNNRGGYSNLFEAAAAEAKNIIIKETCTFDGNPFGVTPSQGGSTFTDPRDRQIYRTVTIGDYRWMAQNINFKTPNSWCYDNNDDNCAKYGRLYTWDAAMMACPAGWHVPDRDEWDGLVEIAGGKNVAGKKLKSKTDWNGTDELGFAALPSGGREVDGTFMKLDSIGGWWNSTETQEGEARGGGVNTDDDSVDNGSVYKTNGFSVRCIQAVY